MVVDLGRHIVLTEICQKSEIDECSTQMELEEQLYTKLTIESSDIQILLCNHGENWREAKNENDSDLHLVPKFSFSATMAYCVQALKTIPKQVFITCAKNLQ